MDWIIAKILADELSGQGTRVVSCCSYAEDTDIGGLSNASTDIGVPCCDIVKKRQDLNVRLKLMK